MDWKRAPTGRSGHLSLQTELIAPDRQMKDLKAEINSISGIYFVLIVTCFWLRARCQNNICYTDIARSICFYPFQTILHDASSFTRHGVLSHAFTGGGCNHHFICSHTRPAPASDGSSRRSVFTASLWLLQTKSRHRLQPYLLVLLHWIMLIVNGNRLWIISGCLDRAGPVEEEVN